MTKQELIARLQKAYGLCQLPLVRAEIKEALTHLESCVVLPVRWDARCDQINYPYNALMLDKVWVGSVRKIGDPVKYYWWLRGGGPSGTCHTLPEAQAALLAAVEKGEG